MDVVVECSAVGSVLKRKQILVFSAASLVRDVSRSVGVYLHAEIFVFHNVSRAVRDSGFNSGFVRYLNAESAVGISLDNARVNYNCVSRNSALTGEVYRAEYSSADVGFALLIYEWNSIAVFVVQLDSAAVLFLHHVDYSANGCVRCSACGVKKDYLVLTVDFERLEMGA